MFIVQNGKPMDMVTREVNWLKRRVLNIDRAGSERWRQISLLYRVADHFGRRLYRHTLCARDVSRTGGCTTGQCCRCRPDVFAYEKEILDLLPKRIDDSGYCPFFNLSQRTCGIYGVRPFACRIYYNPETSRHYCQNPNDATLQLFDGVKRHVEAVLGSYVGGYQYNEAQR